jgi:hypothetical protein
MNQDLLRERVKLAKVYNDEYSYKDFAEYLDVKPRSFYNWLHGDYQLSSSKYDKLNDFIADLLY